MPDVSKVVWPLPVKRSPFHTVRAERVVAMVTPPHLGWTPGSGRHLPSYGPVSGWQADEPSGRRRGRRRAADGRRPRTHDDPRWNPGFHGGRAAGRGTGQTQRTAMAMLTRARPPTAWAMPVGTSSLPLTFVRPIQAATRTPSAMSSLMPSLIRFG